MAYTMHLIPQRWKRLDVDQIPVKAHEVYKFQVIAAPVSGPGPPRALSGTHLVPSQQMIGRQARVVSKALQGALKVIVAHGWFRNEQMCGEALTHRAWMTSMVLYRANVSGSAESPAVSQP